MVNALTRERITERGGSLVGEYVYEVGNAGERLSVEEAGGRKATYAYDGLYRLTGETVTENGTTSVKTYAYDAAGDLAVGDSIQALSGDVGL